MSVEKMKLISVVGPIQEFDRVVSEHILSFDIHLENAVTLLNKTKGIYPFSEENEWNNYIAKTEEIFSSAGVDIPNGNDDGATLSEQAISDTIDTVLSELSDKQSAIAEMDKRIADCETNIQQLEHLLNLDVNLEDVFDFRFVKFRFGRMPKASYKKMLAYLNDIDAFFIEGSTDETYVYGVYFMPAASEEKIDAIFSSLYYERIMITGEASGKPDEAFAYFKQELETLRRKQENEKKNIAALIDDHLPDLAKVYLSLKKYSAAEGVKRLSAHTKESFYVMGWVSKRDLRAIEAKLDKEPKVMVVEEDPEIVNRSTPPIKLKNSRFFKPFELFIKMYGLPSYNEIDPTKIVALTYILMFGIMFGDVGHGFILAVGGFILYKVKKMDLAGIMAAAGAVSTVFGFIYGALFGNEEILRANPVTARFALLEPMKDINTILIGAVALGVVIILFSMTLGIINSFKRGEPGAALFGQNGIAGLVFYVSVLVLAVNMLMGKSAGLVPEILIAVTLIIIFLKEPLIKLSEGKKNWKPESVGEFLLESFFELFEIILSFATNTISYVRLGAFAMAHASMMSVVFIIGNMAGPGVGYAIVMILGNALVMGLEGLIVGIQALRLEFYEMFSRYYTGDGREFVSVKDSYALSVNKK